MRVVSLLPSATEIVAALGHRSELVGRSEECDFPPEVRDLPVIMRARDADRDRSSREIDARVRSARARGRSLYELDVEGLRRLAPDLILTQDLCGVCSVTPEEVATACSRADVRPRLLSLTPRRLEEVWATVLEVARALGDEAAGRTLRDQLRAPVRPELRPAVRPRVAVVEWLDPPILAGLWTPDMVAAAGGFSVGPRPGRVGRRTTWEELASSRIDLLVLSPCSFSVDRTLVELRDRILRERVNRLVPRLGIYVADEAYFSRPGPRLKEGIRLVRDLVAGEHGSAPMPVASLRGPAAGAFA